MLGREANLRHAAHEPSPSDANVILGGMGAPVGRVLRWGNGGSKRSTQQERSDLFDRLLER